MDCHDFEVRLESLLDGDLGSSESASCLQHAEGCPACGELLTAVRGTESGVADDQAELLVGSVLERTIGSVCGQAEEKLPEYVDHHLEPADRELLQLHLNDCGPCRQLVSTLSFMNRELPKLAEVPLDDSFTERVLAAMFPARIRAKRWLRKHSSTWVRRPRFAMEAAYVGLLVIMLVLGAFSTPLAALPQKGLDLVQPDPNTTSVWTQTSESLGTFWEWVASLFEKADENQKKTEES